MTKMVSMAVVIPTYNRGAVLLDTIELLFSQERQADEIIIVDQTDYAVTDPVASRLRALNEQQKIRWLRQATPSIPKAMNQGLMTATSDWVLFLDDDVHFNERFIAEHKAMLERSDHVAHVGQIIQPWQREAQGSDYTSTSGLTQDLDFPFNSDTQATIHNCMAGNLCVNRRVAIDVGGFDTQFNAVAYRFETEFCRRLIAHTQQPFLFAPLATLDHLKVTKGGTREHAQNHLTSLSGAHSVGDYYFALLQIGREGLFRASVFYILRRFAGSIIARFYLRQPWWIPVRLVAELRGFLSACLKRMQGPKRLSA